MSETEEKESEMKSVRARQRYCQGWAGEGRRIGHGYDIYRQLDVCVPFDLVFLPDSLQISGGLV